MVFQNYWFYFVARPFPWPLRAPVRSRPEHLFAERVFGGVLSHPTCTRSDSEKLENLSVTLLGLAHKRVHLVALCAVRVVADDVVVVSVERLKNAQR